VDSEEREGLYRAFQEERKRTIESMRIVAVLRKESENIYEYLPILRVDWTEKGQVVVVGK
jgi:hypothetical protein